MAQFVPGPSKGKGPQIASEKDILARDIQHHQALSLRLDQIAVRLRDIPHITAQEFQNQASASYAQGATAQHTLSDSYKTLLASLSNLRRLISLDAQLSTALIAASRLRHAQHSNARVATQQPTFDSRSMEIDEIIWDLEQLKVRMDVEREEWTIRDAVQRIERLRTDMAVVVSDESIDPRLQFGAEWATM